MAKMEQEENTAIDKKAAKRAAKMKKKEEKKKRKGQQGDETEGEEGGKLLIVLVTLIIIVVWLAILALLIKLDVGGFGSTVLHPMLKDVPYVNVILPETKEDENVVVDVQYPYTTVEAAIARIKELEVELSEALEGKKADGDTVTQLQAEIARLQKFEQEQSEFQELKTEFYQEIVFSDNAPEIEEYRKYYESIDAANAAELYKQVVQQETLNDKIEEYVETYAAMKPKQAAAIMEEMKDDLKLVAEILEHMDAEARGDILGAMDSALAAKVTKLMKPE